MKAKLEFDMENPGDRQEHLRCIKSLDMSLLLFYIQCNLKKEMINDSTPDDYVEGVNDTIHHICELMIEKGIIIDDLLS